MASYDFWLGGCYGLTLAELLEDVGLRAQPCDWLGMDMVPIGHEAPYLWYSLKVS